MTISSRSASVYPACARACVSFTAIWKFFPAGAARSFEQRSRCVRRVSTDALSRDVAGHSGLNELVAHRITDKRRGRTDAELAHRGGTMRLDRLDADFEQ